MTRQVRNLAVAVVLAIAGGARAESCVQLPFLAKGASDYVTCVAYNTGPATFANVRMVFRFSTGSEEATFGPLLGPDGLVGASYTGTDQLVGCRVCADSGLEKAMRRRSVVLSSCVIPNGTGRCDGTVTAP